LEPYSESRQEWIQPYRDMIVHTIAEPGKGRQRLDYQMVVVPAAPVARQRAQTLTGASETNSHPNLSGTID
jgi:hypothetical protein